jgi:hypothetical protein
VTLTVDISVRHPRRIDSRYLHVTKKRQTTVLIHKHNGRNGVMDSDLRQQTKMKQVFKHSVSKNINVTEKVRETE